MRSRVRLWFRATPFLAAIVAVAQAADGFSRAAGAQVQMTSGRTQESAQVQGVLRNEHTRGPVPLGEVRLMSSTGEPVRIVKSDRFGRFTLPAPAPGTYHLQAERDGFRPKVTGEFSLPPGHVLSIEVPMVPSPEDTATGRIQGALLEEETRAPISQGAIRLVDEGGKTVLAVVSDREGRFAFQTPGPGNYHLQVSALGYQTKESGRFSIPPEHVLSVEIFLGPDPLPLESVEVIGRRRDLKPTEQLLQGRLVDYETGAPVPQATVTLSKAYASGADQALSVEQVLSDDRGLFSFITPIPGTYRLRGERIGYRTTESPDLHLMPGDTVVLDLRMSTEAVVLDPITIRASARPWSDRYLLLGMEGFFTRQSRFGNSGVGTFLTRDSIAKYDGRFTTTRMLLSTVTDVRAVNAQGGVVLVHECNPRYYLDGAEIVRGDPVRRSMLDTEASTPIGQGYDVELAYPPENLEGIEVYVSPTIPVEFSQGYPCGVVALWTRRR